MKKSYAYLLAERIPLSALSIAQQKRAAGGRWMAKRVADGYYLRRIGDNPEQAASLYERSWRLVDQEK